MPDETATELFAALQAADRARGVFVAERGYPELLTALEANACEDGDDPGLPCCVARRALATERAAIQEALR